MPNAVLDGVNVAILGLTAAVKDVPRATEAPDIEAYYALLRGEPLRAHERC